MRIAYLDGPRLRRAFLAGAERVEAYRAELNRINVFPVPDGDTGTNLVLTLRAVRDRLGGVRVRPVAAVAREAAEAAILGARGNCGMIFSHFLLGFAEGVEGRGRLGTREFGEAMARAARGLYDALEEPVEGTILTVIRESAEEATTAAVGPGAADYLPLLERLVARAREALSRTPTLLPELREAGVVDAGGKGFVRFLEGVADLVSGGRPGGAPEEAAGPGGVVPVGGVWMHGGGAGGRFCTEALVRGPDLPGAEEVRRALAAFGDSVLAIRGSDLLKVHVHTDRPDAVLSYLRTLGRLAAHKAEDMVVQRRAVSEGPSPDGLPRRPVSVVTDSACDLPEEVVRAHGIHVVPLTLIRGGASLRDRIDMDAATFLELLRAGEHPTTSQPPPAAFLEAYREAGLEGGEVVAVLLSSGLSGTFASAEAAARLFDGGPVHLVDSRGASLLEGLLALKACELAEAGVPGGEIPRRLAAVRDRSGIFFTVGRYHRLVASGRVGRGRARLAELLRIRPIFALDREGRIRLRDRVVGAGRVLPRMMAHLRRELPPGEVRARFGVVHVDAPAAARRAVRAIRGAYGEVDVLVSPATPVLATHLGPGAWGLGYLGEG